MVAGALENTLKDLKTIGRADGIHANALERIVKQLEEKIEAVENIISV